MLSPSHDHVRHITLRREGNLDILVGIHGAPIRKDRPLRFVMYAMVTIRDTEFMESF